MTSRGFTVVGRDRSARLRWLFRCVAVVLGACLAWRGRYEMNQDGIAYLDVADAYLSGRGSDAINGYWSPLYSWMLAGWLGLLRPGPALEIPAVQTLNFILYLSSVGAFDLFLGAWLDASDDAGAEPEARDRARSAVTAVGYGLFLWSSVAWLPIVAVTPDLCVASLFFVALALLLRLRGGRGRLGSHALLGAVLGLAYLAKAAMFPLAFVFLAVATTANRGARSKAAGLGIGLASFAAVALPFLIPLSLSTGRVTFGESGRLNYAWFVQGVPNHHWSGEPAGSGRPRHEQARLLVSPAVYSLQAPFRATYAPTYDPSYWYEGLELSFSWRAQASALGRNLRAYAHMVFRSVPVALGALAMLLVAVALRPAAWFQSLRRGAVVLVPCAAALLLYALVYVESRHVAAPLVVVGLWIVGSALGGRSSRRGSLVVALLCAAAIAAPSAYAIRSQVHASEDGERRHVAAAETLHAEGLREGDRVAWIGRGVGVYWARLARVRVVAEVSRTDFDAYWAADAETRARVLAALARTDAVLVVAEASRGRLPDPEWHAIGDTDLLVKRLRR